MGQAGNHRHVVTYLGTSTFAGCTCLVTEYMSRGDLSKMLRTAQLKPSLPVVRIGRGACVLRV